MNTIQNYTKSELESFFAKDFSHPTFPKLAELYLKEYDLDRARRVCRVGLGTVPDNVDAQYILAKIELLDNNITKAEKILKESYNSNIFSEKIIKLLVEVRDELNRSKHETKKIIDRLLDNIPDDAYANQWIHNYSDLQLKNITKKNKENKSSYNNVTFKVDRDLVSVTFYHILKNQKYYNQALTVLDLLHETNKVKSHLYKSEKKELNNFLNQ